VAIAVQTRRTKSSDRRRLRLVAARWMSVVAMAFVAGSIVLLALTGMRAGLASFAAAPAWVLVCASVLLGAICLHHAGGRWLQFTGLQHVSTYPPLWLAGLAGAAGIAFLLAKVPTIRESVGVPAEYSAPLSDVGLYGAASVAGLLLLSLCQVAWRACSNRFESRNQADQEQDERPATKSLCDSFEGLTSWLADDSPVVSDEDDAFGHLRIARRIASRLLEEHPPAQAIVGRLGAGKTTLQALVVNALKSMGGRARYVNVVAVELWPYETPRAAVEGVIRALVDALAREVNVTALRGIPESYVHAMSSAGGIWSAIAHLQGSPANPFDALQRIDAIATAIGQRYVVWVEDLERFAGHGVGNDQETPEEAERLNPIRALLHGLDRLDSVTVVTATTSLHIRIDLEKIARFVEQLPELPELEVTKIISTFREGCRDRFNTIDPAHPRVRKELDKLGGQQNLEIRHAMFGKKIHSLHDALPVLCSTPRALKQALRSALDTWKRLAGEIDVDDLLAMSILREAEPEVFALVGEHVDALRGSGVSPDERRNAHQEWDVAFGKMALDDRRRRAVGELVKFVFNEQHAEEKPQGFRNARHTDYWERFLAVPTLSKPERDQDVLRVVLADDDEALLGLLEDAQRSDAVESFSRLLKTDRLRRLFVPLIKRRTVENPSRWPDGHPLGMMPLWRMWLRRSERGELKSVDVLEEIRKALDLAVPASLYLAVQIEQYFVIPGGGVHDMLRDGNGTRADEGKRYLRELVVATYSGKPEALANALVGAHLPTLLWVCWGLDRVRANEMTGEPFPSWSAMAVTILDAARLRPIELIPQIAVLVVRESTVFARGGNFAQQYDLDIAAASNLFGSVDVVLDVFEPQDRSRWSGMGPVEVVFAAVDERRTRSLTPAGDSLAPSEAGSE
jgi:hypothetical protein